MTHLEAAAASSFSFAIRPSMLFGFGEQFLIGSEESSRYYRLAIQNADRFSDWQPLSSKEPLESLKRYYPYIEIQEPVAAQGQVAPKDRKRHKK